MAGGNNLNDIQNVLAQDLIRRNIQIVDLYEKITYSSEEIRNYTQFLKHKIYKELNGYTHGKVVYVNINDFFIVVCSLIATWELGAGIFLNDVDGKIKSLPYFKKFYEVIDVVIGTKSLNQWWIPKNTVLISTDDFQIQKNQLVEESNFVIDKPVTADSICYYTTSSGTTGDPKLLSFTHYQTVTLSNYIKDYLSLDDYARPYHYKTMHHGSLFNSFALPLLNSCSTHYCGLFTGRATEFLEKVNDQIKFYNLSHFLVPYNWIRNYNEINDVNFDNHLTLVTIMGNTNSEMIDLFNRFRPKQVCNYFGSSEVGTMFISRTTKANLDDYNPNRFTDIVPTIDYELLENQVKVKWKNQKDWYVLSDRIVKTDNGLWYYGRDLYFESNGQKLEIAKLNNFLKEYLDTDNFTLVPDYKLEKLYLNLYDKDFFQDQVNDLNIAISNAFSPNFILADIYNFNKADVEYGMKISGSLLLFLFRERNNAVI